MGTLSITFVIVGPVLLVLIGLWVLRRSGWRSRRSPSPVEQRQELESPGADGQTAPAFPAESNSRPGDLETAPSSTVHPEAPDDRASGNDVGRQATGERSEEAEEVARMSEELVAQGNLDAALKGFRRALRLDGRSLRAHLGLSRLFLELGKNSKARQHLLTVLRENPSLAPALVPHIRSTFDDRPPLEDEDLDQLLFELAAIPEATLWVRLEQVDLLYQKDELNHCRELLTKLLQEYSRTLEVHEAYVNLLIELDDESALQKAVERLLDLVYEELLRFHCRQCGHPNPTPFLVCPSCGRIGTLKYHP